ncbi:ATP-binding protein [uncultured Helicobacter sp.]|uniref:ATP-binding protein n=1 Tax=uncultured Helicobacter sp. TaxID=175537 RepID=UPI00261F9FF6|nr:ATP-binding protein [uncultured Helicobacter sp.]
MQNSYADIKGLAERTYKNKKNGVSLILREAISNAIHACIIEKTRRGNIQYIPKIEIKIDSKNNMITIKDNGIGFSLEDKQTFFNIAKQNKLKTENNLPSKGLGRLVYLYFSEKISFDTINSHKEFLFEYPSEDSLFDELQKSPQETNETNGTILTLTIKESLLKTFINRYKQNMEKLQEWILNIFAFLLYDLNDLNFSITIDEKTKSISLNQVDKECHKITIQGKEYNVSLLSVKGGEKLAIKLVAHKLLVDKDLKYDREIKELRQTIYVASPLLDDRITHDGLSVEIDDIKNEIEEGITKILDEKFKSYFEKQQNESIQNLSNTKQKFPFLADFMQKPSSINGHKIITKEDFVKEAIEEKGNLEKSFWLQEDSQLDDKLQKSALYLYVKHRERVLKLLEKMIGDSNFSEDDFHQLLTDKKCENLAIANHNLWLLDDKFSYFTEGHNSRRGKSEVDVEFYINPFIDNESRPSHIVLVELKKLKKAHNAGEMIKQIKKYAESIYNKGQTKGGIDIDMSECKFFGYIIANNKDIENEHREFGSPDFKKIPYTKSSFEGNINFYPKNQQNPISMYLTLFASQDLLNIAKLRNKILFEMLQTPKPQDEKNNE